jgi:hypothetical protein
MVILSDEPEPKDLSRIHRTPETGDELRSVNKVGEGKGAQS